MLGLLEALDREHPQSQRHLAAELGIALGLVNAYLKRCINKGLVKVSEAPARRYAYYLTPLGFAEKSRLTVEYLTSSFGFFRQAKGDCSKLFQAARSRGFRKLLLAGRSDLAEVAALCAAEQDIEIVGLVDGQTQDDQFMRWPAFADVASCKLPYDAIMITDFVHARQAWERAVQAAGRERVLLPDMLRSLTGVGEVER
jgi:DNA-binding MarR family transcriptional regulator